MTEQYNIGYICTYQQCERGYSDKVAFRWIEHSTLNRVDYTFLQLEEESNRFANVLKEFGFTAGDIIYSFLPKSPHLYFAFLGIVKTNAIAGMIFSNFGDEALIDRLIDAKGIVTKHSLLKKIKKILPRLTQLKYIFVVDIDEHLSENILSFPQLMRQSSVDFEVPYTQAETPSVLLYTSGSTSKPKGVLHRHGGIVLQQATAQTILKLNEQEIYWCTADPGWITGITYGITAPWSLGVTQVHFGGAYDARTWYSILEREKVSIWYTSPTALRMLMRENREIPDEFQRDSLKYIFSVGEPLNPEVLKWGREVLQRDIYDTWFQSETGCIMIANRPGLPIKPGSMGKPIPEISAAIVGGNGEKMPVSSIGNLCIYNDGLPIFKTYLQNEDLYQEKFKCGYYYSGDKAYCDDDGYFWFIGRADDVINTSGHLVSPFEVESSLLEIEEIVEAGVIGAPDELLYEKVVAFIVLKPSQEWSAKLEVKIRLHIMNRLSSVALPSEIIVIDNLPKNKSGKILRRVLKARYLNEDPGDISTMEA